MKWTTHTPGRSATLGLLLLLAASSFLRSIAGSADDKMTPAERLRPAGIDGALVLGGGGKMPDAVLDRFVKLAGGDKAHLVVLADRDIRENSYEPWKSRKPATV